MFNENGYLTPGFHDWTEREILEKLVLPFSESKTRLQNYTGYLQLCKILKDAAIPFEQWIDGSFSTSKMDPGDIDLLTVIDKDLLDALPENVQNQIAVIFRGKQTKAALNCDSFLLVKVPDNHPDFNCFRQNRKYWMGEFGFDRGDLPKGIVRTVTSPTPQQEKGND